MRELDCVKIVKLLDKDRNFDGTEGVKRPPKVSDVGTIVFLKDEFCMIECVDSDGHTIWLADFLTEELEVLENGGS